MSVDPKKVDKAFEHFHAFSKISAGTTRELHKMREDVIFKDSVFLAKHKALIAALWGVSARCEPCLTYYILRAKELGATEAEVGEVLAIGSAMGGCVGETWALKAYKAFMEGDTPIDCACEVDLGDSS
jgi:alkylhydroperoxidase/carboxymuconolactone decarboxylase family protein YurZ